MNDPLPRHVGLPPAPVELTCAVDGLSHQIAEPDFLAGLVRANGYYRARCGRTVLASSLLAVPGRRCSGCARTGG